MRGSIRQRGANSWLVRVSVGRDPTTGRYQYVNRTVRGTKRDAQRAAAELVTEVERGSHRQPGRHTVSELLDRWMDHIEGQGRAASTLIRYRSAITANIRPRIGNLTGRRWHPGFLRRRVCESRTPGHERSRPHRRWEPVAPVKRRRGGLFGEL